MPIVNPNYPEPSVSILALSGNDARNAGEVLGKAKILSNSCVSMADFCKKAGPSTGALLISEETLDAQSLELLLEHLKRQPRWSDLPIVLLTNAGETSAKVYNILNFLDGQANVTLLEKPLKAITLIGVIRAALRSRKHQYEVRSLLETYTLAMEGAHLGSWDLDLTTHETRRSVRHDQIFGYDQLQPKWSLEIFLNHVLAEDRTRVKSAFDEARVQKTLFFECRIVWPDKTIRWISAQGRVLEAEANGHLRLAGIVTDITERKELEKAARIERERLDLTLDATAMGIWYWDIPERRFTCNSRFKDQHGLSSETNIIPETLFKQLAPEYLQHTRDAISKTLTEGRVYDNEYLTVNQRWIRAIGQVFFDGVGSAVRFDGITMDVTKRKKELDLLHQTQQDLQDIAVELDERVKHRTAKLEETLSEMEAFSYSVSHDLRAPLRAMQGYSRHLLGHYSEKLDEEGQELLSRINKSAERLDRLTQDVLTYSRVVRNPMEMTPISLEKLIPEIIQQYPNFREEYVDIVILPPLLTVMGHEASLIQCVSNLINNAVKFVPNGVKPRIKIWTEHNPESQTVRLWLEDNGIGIEPDQTGRIFGIFERVSKDYEGTGIGLAIVKKAMQRMGGSVGVESTLGVGSKFWLEFLTVKL